MSGTKTSVWLGEEQHAQWKASGDSLTTIIKRGLAAPKTDEVERPATVAEVREIVEAAEGRLHRIIRDELERIAGQSNT